MCQILFHFIETHNHYHILTSTHDRIPTATHNRVHVGTHAHDRIPPVCTTTPTKAPLPTPAPVSMPVSMSIPYYPITSSCPYRCHYTLNPSSRGFAWNVRPSDLVSEKAAVSRGNRKTTQCTPTHVLHEALH